MNEVKVIIVNVITAVLGFLSTLPSRPVNCSAIASISMSNLNEGGAIRSSFTGAVAEVLKRS
jgi:hypothetical protein